MEANRDDAGMAARRLHALIAARASHWRRTRRITGALLALWLAVTFGTVFFARELAAITVLGWPLSFYLAAQGASLACLAIIGAYAWLMQRVDQDFERRQRELA